MTMLNGLAAVPLWPISLIFGYPIVAVLLFEAARRVGTDQPVAANVLRQMLYLVLPTGTIWLVLRYVALLPADDLAARVAVTVFAISALYMLLRVAQAILIALIDEERHAPKLLFDLVRIGLAIACGAIVVSAVWDVNLASLLAAMGVGSIVLGFALQDVAGNFVSGLGLLYQGKFSIGDWIVVEGKVAQVVELDWRSVTLQSASGERIIAANSSLAKSNVVIAAKSGEERWADVPLEFALGIPPERVRAAVLETGRAMEEVVGRDGVRCRVSGYSTNSIRYAVALRVANPSILSGPRDEFLSRFWYVAQRPGLCLGVSDDAAAQAPPMMDEAARGQALAGARLFGKEPELIAALARDAAYQCYRAGEILLQPNEPASQAFLVVSGTLRTAVPGADEEFWMERLDAGQTFVVREMLQGAPSPVRLVAESDAGVLALPAARLAALLDTRRPGARDLAAVIEARRRSVAALARGIRAVA